MVKIPNMKLVGRDGDMLLYASKDRKTGVLYDSLRKTKSKPQPLQVFFKWGNFEPVEAGETTKQKGQDNDPD